MLRKGLARRALAGEGRHRGGSGRRRLGLQLVLAGRRLQLLELELQLIQQARLALGARAVQFRAQLLDLKLQAGDQGVGVGGHRPGPGRLGFRRIRSRLGLRQGGAQAGDVVGRGGGHGASLPAIVPKSRRIPA